MLNKPFFYYLQRLPNYICGIILSHLKSVLSDKLYLKLLFRIKMGRWLNLKDPVTFSEKLQWLKLYDRKPEYSKMVDKAAVKDYVAKKIGVEYVIPTLGIWEKPEDIEWNKLPDSFVLKTTHSGGSTGVVICKDKTTFDRQNAINKLKKSLKQDTYSELRAWPYKNVPKRIIAETYITPSPGMKDLPDYKWYCFNGEPKYCQVIQNRTTNETIDFFDTNWNHLNFVGLSPVSGPFYKSSAIPAECPENLDKQIHIAFELSKNIPFSRIDLFEVRGRTYFGEITFYPMSGMGVFKPDHYNELLGKMIKMPSKQ